RSGVFVLDIDGLDAEAELRRLEMEHNPLPGTVEVITGRGRHCYFQMPDTDLRNSTGRIAHGLDVRANGGYALAPPSVHPSGRRYCWSVDRAAAIAAAPAWLLRRLAVPVRTNGPTRSSDWRQLVQGAVEGTRDCSATKLAGYLLRRRVDPFVALELL